MQKRLAAWFKPCIIFISTLLATGYSAGLMANSAQVETLLGSALGCELARRGLADMPIANLYIETESGCAATRPSDTDATQFSDASCAIPVNFESTSMTDYCINATSRAVLGNGFGIVPDTWTLTPGNRLDVGARSLEGLQQPYMQRLVYRQVNTADGICNLEMRVYKSHPGARDTKSLLALHGGSWTSRSFGFLGLELTIPHFVSQGFTVYAPFYRLLDTTDSSAACNNALFEDITDDASAALSWVLENNTRYGDTGLPVVFGQSAGGHLALSLAINQPESVAGLIAFYPPTDFTDFIERVQSGNYTNPQGLSILDRVVNGDSESVNAQLPLVVNNSFPQRIESEAADWPPMYLLQGASDELVEYRQSVRVCDALGGRSLNGAEVEVAPVNELLESISCTAQTSPASVLKLIQEGEHALDVCLNDLFSDLCPSGGAASRALVSQSINDAAQFAAAVNVSDGRAVQPVDNEAPDSDSGSSDDMDTDGDLIAMTVPVVMSSGGGAFGVFSLLLLLGVLRNCIHNDSTARRASEL